LQRRLWPGTIRTRLFLMVQIAALMLVGVRMVHLNLDGEVMLAKARVQAVELARKAVRSGVDVVDQSRLSLDILSRVPVIQAGTMAECSTLLATVVRTRDWAAGLHVLDSTGTVICSSHAENIGLNIADRPYVRAAKTNQVFAVGDFMQGRVNGLPLIGSALPVVSPEGRVERILVATIASHWFNRFATELKSAHPGSTLTLIDGAGAVLANHPDAAEKPGSVLSSDSMLAGLRTLQSSGFEAVGSDGRDRIFGVGGMPNGNAALLVGLSRDNALADLVRSRNQAIAELAILCWVMATVMWSFGRLTVDKPLRAMLAHARQIGNGRLEMRLESRRWPRELALLARTMNRMADRIERRNQQLITAQTRLRHQARTDPLTGLGNRRAFDKAFNRIWLETYVEQQPLSVAMVDADFFKRYNDTYGHSAGDAVLVRIGALLRDETARAKGFVARLGGEEFAILLPGHDETSSLRIADRICRALHDKNIVHGGSMTGRVTVSIGVAGLVPPSEHVDRLVLRSADAALYGAKAAGRNRAMGNSRISDLSGPPNSEKWLDRA
jgi:diguanylate cyclase (GGDEF)-like protein